MSAKRKDQPMARKPIMKMVKEHDLREVRYYTVAAFGKIRIYLSNPSKHKKLKELMGQNSITERQMDLASSLFGVKWVRTSPKAKIEKEKEANAKKKFRLS